MDVMKLKFALVTLGALAAASGPAGAEGLAWGTGLKDPGAPLAPNLRWGAGLKEMAVPAPIPVPAPVPVPEGFTYYLRADLGWGFTGDRSYSENGRVFGNDGGAFVAVGGPFTSSAFAGPGDLSNDGSFIGTIGTGMYFSPRLRGDLTLDFRSKQKLDADSTYSYVSTTPGTTVSGVIHDRFSLRSVVGLANLYWDILPRGLFSPYIGAGIGFVYNDAIRNFTDTETAVSGVGTTAQVVSGSSKDKNVALAGALMAGATFAFDHHWALDVGYRALFLDGVDVATALNSPTASNSKASLGDQWEHQVRVGLRFNIW